jgi:hypothetical protein
MKKLLNAIVITLAINFIALAGGVGWLVQSKKLDREKVQAIKLILFPAPVEEKPTTQPVAADPTTQPTLRLEELLAKESGRPATEQVQFIQDAFQAQQLLIERRMLELKGLERQVENAKQQMEKDRAVLESDKKALELRQTEAARLASDKGFKNTLEKYLAMPAKQVKSIFLTLDDATVTSYLQAMDDRSAAKIIKEFKEPEEMKRIQKIMERMRLAQAPTQ